MTLRHVVTLSFEQQVARVVMNIRQTKRLYIIKNKLKLHISVRIKSCAGCAKLYEIILPERGFIRLCSLMVAL